MPFKKGRREGVGDGVIRETSLPGQTLYSRESCSTIRVFITASDFLFGQVKRSPGQDVSPLSKPEKFTLGLGKFCAVTGGTKVYVCISLSSV